MQTLTLDELTAIDGGDTCVPFGLAGALLYIGSGGDICFGIYIN